MDPVLSVIDPDGDVLFLLRHAVEIQDSESVNHDQRGRATSQQRPVVVEILTDDDEDSESGFKTPRSTCTPDEILSLHFLVSSKHMSLASPVFKSMLGPRFQEGSTLRSKGKVEIPLPDDHPVAFGIVLDIIHCRLGKVPLKVDLDLLAHIAILVDKYQMVHVADVFIDIWTKALPSPPSTLEDNLLPWLAIAWVFDLSKEFALLTSVLQSCSEGDVGSTLNNAKWCLPIPDTIRCMSAETALLLILLLLKRNVETGTVTDLTAAIESSRATAIRTLLAIVDVTISLYTITSPGSTRCTSTYESLRDQGSGVSQSAFLALGEMSRHRRDCDDLALGSFIRSSSDLGIYPLPSSPYRGWSYTKICKRIAALDISTGCAKLIPENPRPSYLSDYNRMFGHNKVPQTRCMKIRDNWQAEREAFGRELLGGLKLEDFKKTRARCEKAT